MFDRFTDRSRKVMGYARQEAERLKHDYIGTEHVLLGLVKEGSGVAANILENLDIDLDKVRAEVERNVKEGPETGTMGQLPFTQHAKKVLDYANEEARHLGHRYVGTEHLLLGLLCEKEGRAAKVLVSLGARLDDVRREVIELLGGDVGPGPEAEGTAPRMPFTERAAKAIKYAEEEARVRGKTHVRIAHLLGGIARLEEDETS